MNSYINFCKGLLLICILFLFTSGAYSQSARKEIKQFHIGDKIPDFKFTKVLHSKAKNISASSLYKPGLLIINFWATWCVPCIRQMSTLDSLNRKYSPQLNIACVTDQGRQPVINFFNGNKDVKAGSLLLVTGNTGLAKAFPHQTIPHNIWINKSGVIIAITGDEEINEINIKKAIGFQATELKERTENLSFDPRKPFTTLDDSANIARVIFTKYQSKILNGGSIVSNLKQVKRYFAWNTKMIDIYWKALMNTSKVNYNQIEVHTNDSTKFFDYSEIKSISGKAMYKNRDDWKKENLYCYEINLAHPVADTLLNQFIAMDLYRFFGIKAKIENRDILCWVIKKETSSELPRSSTALSKLRFGSDSLVIHNTPSFLFNSLYQLYLNKERLEPIVDETGIDYPIHVNLNVAAFKGKGIPLNFILEKLKLLGFNIVKAKRIEPVLVIYDR
jgi:thiol-disulfide isomerase/thioredoxin